jgi:hypothetical protein
MKAVDVRIGLKHWAVGGIGQRMQFRLRVSAPQRGDGRRGEQSVADREKESE